MRFGIWECCNEEEIETAWLAGTTSRPSARGLGTGGLNGYTEFRCVFHTETLKGCHG